MTSQTEAMVSVPDMRLVGIGGWLILPAIGLILGPVVSVVGLIAAMAFFSEITATGHGDLFAFELVLEAGFVVFTIYVATRFFAKKSDAPSIFIALQVAGVMVSLMLLVIELGAGADEFAVESGKHLVRGVIGAAIWIPYFMGSKRVKATFTA